ncbi:amino acid adenylation domain-containing protein [Neobacillus mesonae]|nr:amino acid adenylation domain-containing protein [Neobacillus mesonae]
MNRGRDMLQTLAEKSFFIDGKRLDIITRFLTNQGMEPFNLFFSAYGFCANQMSGNDVEALHVVNKYGEIQEVRFEIDKHLSIDSFLRYMAVESTNSRAIEREEDSKQGGILVYDWAYRSKLEAVKYNLALSVELKENGLWFHYSYEPGSYSERKLETMHRRVLHILMQMVHNQDLPLSGMTLIDEVEVAEVAELFNQSDRNYPESKTIVELFEEQVERTPQHIAVEYKGITLTYRELNARANEVGRRLRDLGVGPDSIIGIMTRRSIEMIVGIYGVLKAGGAYLPIDLDLPESRIEYMLKDSRSRVLLTDNGELDSSCYGNFEVLDLTSIEGCHHSNLSRLAGPEHLAYVIYTSGTTGNPKGVMVENRNLVNFALWMLEDEYLPNEVILQKTTYAFDLSIWELFVGFIAGATVVLLPQEDEKEMDKIAEYIYRHKVTRTSFVPSVLETFIPYVGERVGSLRRIQLSGEALPLELANRFNERSRGTTRLVNSYGPTEATVFATSLAVPTATDLTEIHIGKPLANMQIYIMNHNQLCGIGMPGELFIGGKGVSRGYLNRPELTEEKFIVNPFNPREKMYRTGDLAYWREDGSIQYLGRLDDQVKIRGYRIELNEIKSALQSIEGVDSAVVIAQDDNGEKLLCAYIVSSIAADLKVVREHLSKQLPSYMIPQYIMQISEIPVTRNGKLDKKSLPKPEARSLSPYVAPRNRLEESIVEAFCQVLGVKQVGIDDHFFELGGHSLRAAKLLQKISEQTGIQLRIRDILDGQTARNIAKIAETGDRMTPTVANILKLPKAQSYAMSSVQKRIFITQQLHPASVAYNVPAIYEVSGNLDPVRLQEAFQRIIERHEILRTRFTVVHGDFHQIIEEDVLIQMEYEELQDVDLSVLAREFVRPFSLEEAPLVRGKLIKEKVDQYYLLLDVHHIVYDDASANIFLNELFRLYNGEELYALDIQYKDYSAWEQTRNLEGQEAYWLSKYEEEAPLLDMITDFPRPLRQIFEGSSIFTKLEREHKEAIKRLAKASGATDYMILLSCFMQLLSRYTRQTDIVVGSPASGRTHPDTENMMGMFVNTLAIRADVKGKSTFAQFVNEMKETCLSAFENQDYPFERLLEKLNLERDLSRNPLFDVMFVMQNNENKMPLFDLKIKEIPSISTGATFDLTLSVHENDGGYELKWEYCTALYKEETIERLASHFAVLVKEAVTKPNNLLDDLLMLEEMEYHKVVREFNATHKAVPNQTVIELFEKQVEESPGNIALMFEGTSVTYKELNERANHIGHTLRNLGVGPEDIVGLITERSIEMIAGLLGILKAGGAYLPMDPEYPMDRIEYMLQDSRAKWILSGPGSENAIAALQNTTNCPGVVSLKEDDGIRANNLPSVTDPHHLAYVIYTSGTTGNPKGVMVEHRNIVNQAMWQIQNGGYTKQSTVIQKTTYVFDGSVWEIFSALLAGSRLLLITEEDNKDAEKLIRYIPGSHIALIPSMLRMLLDYADANGCGKALRSAERIYLAAEPVTTELLERFEEVTGDNLSKLGNLYGPTEATVTSTSYSFGSYTKSDSVPIGKPVINTNIYIMNNETLCGIGVPGELCIGGAGVTRGYLHLQEMTQERFINNPYNNGERIYRTGDLARWRADGEIEYLGRIGDQVKIRGFRIEVQEIESKIREVEQVYDTAVIVRSDDEEKYLCAYVVGKAELDLTQLKEYLTERLPYYMIPSHFMLLPRLPVTRNGKLDKRALPKPIVMGNDRYIAPRNEAEQKITEFFQSIVKADRVGIDDDFFELGGHSLRATRMVNAIELHFGIRIPLSELLGSSTPRKIAELIAQRKGKPSFTSITPLPEADRYEMSSAQKRIFIKHSMNDSDITYNIPSLYRVNGPIHLERLSDALTVLIHRHELFRTYFIQEDGRYYQMINDTADVPIAYEESVESQILSVFKDFIKPFDLSSAPLIRVKVVQCLEQASYLMIDIHHIIFDEASKSILFNELMSIYLGEELPAAEVQYKDYTYWLNSRDLSKQEAYWLEQFKDEIPVLDLKTDMPRQGRQSHAGSSIISHLPANIKAQVKTLAQKSGGTDYMVLLSAFMQLMGRYSRQDEIVVGSPIFGRVHPDTEQMIGMFVNTLAIRGKLQSDGSFSELVQQMKKKCLEAFDNQEYPFERLVEHVVSERDLSRNPIFDVVFALQNNEQSELMLDGQRVKAIETESAAATFDLTVSMEETEMGYALRWEYCTDLFRKETIERMADHFANLLGNALKQPDKALSELSMFGEGEEQRVLREFNDTKRPYPENMTVIELFEEQVKRVPNQVAAEYNGEQLTYRELNHRANAIGRVLKAHGVGPDRIVGLVTGRSLEMIAGMYGILKAGGAYLPIDPEHPADRIRYMLEDSGAEVVLVGPGGEKAQPALEGRTLVQLTDWRHEVLEDPECKAKPGNLAYIIYTSGTTGNPKGVMIENRSLVNLAAWQRSEGGMNEHSVMLQKSTYIFDAAVWEIFSSGLSGSKLVIATETENQDPAALLELIAKQQVTDALIVPSSFRMLLEYAETHQLGNKLTSLQHIYLGAEAVTNDLLEGYQRVTGHGLSRLNNLYGPTEGTVCVTSLRFKEGDGGVVPIGKPLRNTRIYMLNGDSLCGIGVPGEICIAGAGVARGYLNQPELTAEQFVNHPVLGERLYRTGDIGRWLPDGSIEYMGRKGEQVKLRGFRIELGEIESRLREMKGIQDAVVIVRTDGGDPKLCGYLVSESELDMREVKEQLKKSLPYYMIPSHFMQLASMPQTRSGKLDKKALPKPDREEGSTYVAPRDETERCVAEMFEEILGIEHVSIYDSFFELGGHSLSASRLASLIEQRLAVKLSLRDLMTDRTVNALTAKVKEYQLNRSESLVLQIVAAVEEEV